MSWAILIFSWNSILCVHNGATPNLKIWIRHCLILNTHHVHPLWLSAFITTTNKHTMTLMAEKIEMTTEYKNLRTLIWHLLLSRPLMVVFCHPNFKWEILTSKVNLLATIHKRQWKGIERRQWRKWGRWERWRRETKVKEQGIFFLPTIIRYW